MVLTSGRVSPRRTQIPQDGKRPAGSRPEAGGRHRPPV